MKQIQNAEILRGRFDLCYLLVRAGEGTAGQVACVCGYSFLLTGRVLFKAQGVNGTFIVKSTLKVKSDQNHKITTYI